MLRTFQHELWDSKNKKIWIRKKCEHIRQNVGSDEFELMTLDDQLNRSLIQWINVDYEMSLLDFLKRIIYLAWCIATQQ